MTDLTTLRRLAEAATPGPWYLHTSDDTLVSSESGEIVQAQGEYMIEYASMEADAAYIAAANPQAILALLDELAELRSAIITFCAPWAVTYSKMMGLPPGHIYAAHYDLLEKCGARMVDFVRYEP